MKLTNGQVMTENQLNDSLIYYEEANGEAKPVTQYMKQLRD